MLARVREHGRLRRPRLHRTCAIVERVLEDGAIADYRLVERVGERIDVDRMPQTVVDDRHAIELRHLSGRHRAAARLVVEPRLDHGERTVRDGHLVVVGERPLVERVVERIGLRACVLDSREVARRYSLAFHKVHGLEPSVGMHRPVVYPGRRHAPQRNRARLDLAVLRSRTGVVPLARERGRRRAGVQVVREFHVVVAYGDDGRTPVRCRHVRLMRHAVVMRRRLNEEREHPIRKRLRLDCRGRPHRDRPVSRRRSHAPHLDLARIRDGRHLVEPFVRRNARAQVAFRELKRDAFYAAVRRDVRDNAVPDAVVGVGGAFDRHRAVGKRVVDDLLPLRVERARVGRRHHGVRRDRGAALLHGRPS